MLGQLFNRLTREIPIPEPVVAELPQQAVLPEIKRDMLKDFAEAADVWALEMQKELEKLNHQDSEVAEKLRSLGFTEVPEIRAVSDKARTANELKGQIKNIKTAQGSYKGYVFVPKKQMDEILKKYGLMMGEVNHYKGNIPRENMQAIVEFSNKYEVGIRPRSRSRDDKPCLTILAPPSMFTSEAQKSALATGYQAVPNPDPAVCLEIIDPDWYWRTMPLGFVIVTTWGAEKDIKELNNQV